MKIRVFVGVALVAAFISGHAPVRASDSASIYETLAAMKEHTILSVGVKEAGEIATLKSQATQFTLFAPTDAAFKKLDDATIKKIATDKVAVKRLLHAHLVMGNLTLEELKKLDGKKIPTLQGTALKVEDGKDGLRVGGVRISTANIRCSNGVIHEIDSVLPVPKE